MPKEITFLDRLVEGTENQPGQMDDTTLDTGAEGNDTVTGAEEGTDGALETGADEDGVNQDTLAGGAIDKTNQQRDGKGKGKEPVVTAKQTPDNRPAKPGDLVDQATGKVIARAGGERRLYERAWNDARTRVMPIMQKAEKDVAALRGQLKAYEDTNAVIKQFGLTPVDQTAAMKLIAAYKKDPAAVIKYLLTDAKAAGHNVALGADSGVDVNAISQMIQTQLKPILDRENRTSSFENARGAAQQQLSEFYNNEPNARIHAEEISNIMQRFPNLSLNEAYLRLRLFMSENKLDVTKPLKQQVTAIVSGNKGGNGQRQTQPRVRGRVDPSLTTNVDDAADGELASTNLSYGEITRRAMKRAGFNMQ